MFSGAPYGRVAARSERELIAFTAAPAFNAGQTNVKEAPKRRAGPNFGAGWFRAFHVISGGMNPTQLAFFSFSFCAFGLVSQSQIEQRPPNHVLVNGGDWKQRGCY